MSVTVRNVRQYYRFWLSYYLGDVLRGATAFACWPTNSLAFGICNLKLLVHQAAGSWAQLFARAKFAIPFGPMSCRHRQGLKLVRKACIALRIADGAHLRIL